MGREESARHQGPLRKPPKPRTRPVRAEVPGVPNNADLLGKFGARDRVRTGVVWM